jgi:hypothetical protein
MHQGIPWGSMVIGSSGLSKWWYGREVVVTTFQKLVQLWWAAVLRPMAWMAIVPLASADSCVQFLGHIV